MRPRQGRYLAGVSGALARATNTDPVLWRVLFAVLGIISGVGVLLYLIGWLIIPAEGDAVSPVESLLGKGKAGISPVSVVILGVLAVLSFAFIVQDGMRASLLACGVILGAILLIKRSSNHGSDSAPATSAPATSAPPPPPAQDPFASPAQDPFATAEFAAAPPASATPAPPAATTEPPTAEPPMAEPPVVEPPADEPVTAPMPPVAPPFAPPPGAYRPPFAPHGPYARPTPATYPPAPPAPPRPPKPPKKPKERSKLGRLTFFAVIVVMGVLTLIDMAGASIAVSAYFAAALATVAAGLIVGAWLGRARGLIALGLLLTIGLFIATGTERWGDDVGSSVYRPTSLTQVADRYDFTFGDATIDLRQVDFAGQQQTITVSMKVGQVRVILPPNVDTTAALQVENGRAEVFGKTFEGESIDNEDLTDLGPDGAGGGTLKLDLRLNAGNLEVHR